MIAAADRHMLFRILVVAFVYFCFTVRLTPCIRERHS
jgi:hypothetical protein